MKHAIKVIGGDSDGLYSQTAYEELRLQMSTGAFHTHKATNVKVPNKTRIQIHPSEYKTIEIHGIKFIGKSEYGELHALRENGTFEHYDFYPSSSTADGNSYVSCCGSGYEPKNLKPLTKKDIERIEDAYTTEGLSSCEECGLAYDTEGCDPNPGYIIAGECSFVCREGCFEGWLKRNGIDDYVNKSHKAIPLEAAENLKNVKFIARFIGGMTDPGRGGYWNGERVENGDPKEVLRDLLKKNPKGKYVFSHDESGQFQVYFSVWEVKYKKRGSK